MSNVSTGGIMSNVSTSGIMSNVSTGGIMSNLFTGGIMSNVFTGSIMSHVFPCSAVDNGLVLSSDRTNDVNINICCLFAKNTPVRSKTKHWLGIRTTCVRVEQHVYLQTVVG